ncbi:MAG: hypothetical protein LRY43_03460 [Gammaproteobacteria bacterium]|nr:hypothetical protein [Gammaproteobacteria bacterium]
MHAASTKAPSNEEEETTPARKMLRGQDSARIKNQMSSQQTVLFTNPPEEVGDLSADEICQAIAIFCQQDEHYDGQSPLETTEWCRYPLIFFLLESYQHTKYLTVADKSALSASIKMVMDRYPSARNAVFGGKDPFSYCAYHSLCDLLKILQPSAVELANKNIHCTAIEEVLNVLDIQDNQSLDTLQYLLQILGNAISNEFWSLKIKAIFKNKYYSAREEEPKQRQRHIQTMQLMLDWKILSLSQEFISELTETYLT